MPRLTGLDCPPDRSLQILVTVIFWSGPCSPCALSLRPQQRRNHGHISTAVTATVMGDSFPYPV